MFYTGVNLSGAEAERGSKRGRIGHEYVTPSKDHYDYWFDNSDMNIARLPFRWERLQSAPFAALNPELLKELHKAVDYAAQKGADIILDVHNFGEYAVKLPGGGEAIRTIGSSSVPVSALENLWVKLAQEFKDDKNVWFGLMNEPKTQYTAKQWAGYMQETVNAIRDTGATNKILVSGVQWSSAVTWLSSGNAAAFKGFKDSANNTLFETHQYFDPAGSGMSGSIIDDPVSRVKAITDWARETGQKLFLGEFGISFNNPSLAGQNASGVKEVLNYLSANADVWKGWTAWGGGELWADNYHYKLTKNTAGKEQSESVWLKNYVNSVLSPSTSGENKPEHQNGNPWAERSALVKNTNDYEAEDAVKGGTYQKVQAFAASEGYAVNASGGEGRLQFIFTGKAGSYRIKTHYFDENDGNSYFSLTVNGKKVAAFNANRNFNDPTRSVNTLTEHLSAQVSLNKGDIIVLKGVRSSNELAAADRIELISLKGEKQVAFAELDDLFPGQVKPYDNLQDLSVKPANVTGGDTITLSGNNWKSLAANYEFTENTILSFDFSSTARGEIHALGFDDDNVLSTKDKSFYTVYGSQEIGKKAHNLYNPNEGKQNFTVKTGDFINGRKNNLIIVNDDDNPNDGTGNGTFSKIRIYEAEAEVRGDARSNLINTTESSERLFGGAGADTFVLNRDPLQKTDIVKDFNFYEKDKIDITDFTQGLGFNLSLIRQYVSLTVNGKDGSAELSIDVDGEGGSEIARTVAIFDRGLNGQTVTSLLSRGTLKI